MVTHLPRLAAVLFAAFFVSVSHAQNYILTPAAPTSADTITLSIVSRTCGGFNPYLGNPYRVNMASNAITVTLGQRSNNPQPLCPPLPREEIDLGRLPAGSYAVSVIETSPSFTGEVTNVPFTVSDARALKPAPFASLDYSGHWWDPNDSGWGVFVWHDARDNLLVAWFTYTPDGKPMWYVFQPKFLGNATTADADIVQLTRAPGPTSPPPAPGVVVAVGKAKIDFTSSGTTGRATLTYSFNTGPQLVRTIQRFKP